MSDPEESLGVLNKGIDIRSWCIHLISAYCDYWDLFVPDWLDLKIILISFNEKKTSQSEQIAQKRFLERNHSLNEYVEFNIQHIEYVTNTTSENKQEPTLLKLTLTLLYHIMF